MREKYLCAIGNSDNLKIFDYQVGVYDKDRETFSFKNGSYRDYELKYREIFGGNVTCVISFKKIGDIKLGNRLY